MNSPEDLLTRPRLALSRITTLSIIALLAVAAMGATASSAGATRVYDGASFKKKPATLTGFNGSYGKGEVTEAGLLIGGPDAQPDDYGKIKWTKWTKRKAVGFGTGWHLGPQSYDSSEGANPWKGGRLRVILRAKKNGLKNGRFTRMSIVQKAKWRTETETGLCNYYLSFVFKTPNHKASPWMMTGIGGGWPLTREPCLDIKVD